MPACILFDFNPRTSIRGATYYCLLHWDRVRYFNPRTLRGVRRYTTTMAAQFVEFQSTHPSWGATVDFLVNLFFCDSISIHAPIVGCDLKKTAPTDTLQISIHAPIVGCDRGIKTDTKCKQNFNPRTHRGVRQKMNKQHEMTNAISIHAPIVECDQTD